MAVLSLFPAEVIFRVRYPDCAQLNTRGPCPLSAVYRRSLAPHACCHCRDIVQSIEASLAEGALASVHAIIWAPAVPTVEERFAVEGRAIAARKVLVECSATSDDQALIEVCVAGL